MPSTNTVLQSIIELMTIRARYMHQLTRDYGDILDYESDGDLRDPLLWKKIYLVKFLEHLETVNVSYEISQVNQLLDYYHMLYDELH